MGQGQVRRLLGRYGRARKIGIIPSPGEFYGAPAYLRFSATATDEAIRSACERLTA